jgi:hypothetical protein
MALLPKGWSISRHVLPIAAFVGLLVAVYVMLAGQPDRTLDDPTEKPAHAEGALADAPRVAGSGVVEPSSEMVSIGTSLSGLWSHNRRAAPEHRLPGPRAKCRC